MRGRCERLTTACHAALALDAIYLGLVEKRTFRGRFLDQASPRESVACDLTTTNNRAPGFVRQRAMAARGHP